MTLKVYNTLSRQKEVFEPLAAPDVSMYVCGVTVYSDCHIGHARVYVVFDVIRRYLEHLGFRVRYVQNFTDIDDKIINRAKEKGVTPAALSTDCIDGYFRDMDALGVRRADSYPRATESMDQIVSCIATLVDSEYAYVTPGGDVCYRVAKKADYGKLSNRVLDDMIAGARVDIDSGKENPLDFVLWKSSKPEEPSWSSPWGDGRPGWHIECSAMAIDALGPTIDIHGGGQDLIFPHHENEIAQSESCTGQPFAKYWLHNGFVSMKSEKMSKSLNNVVLIQDLLPSFSGDVIRFFLLKQHYRAPLDYSPDGLEESEHAYQRLVNAVTRHRDPVSGSERPVFDQLSDRFFAALDDDFNFAEALAALFDMVREVNRTAQGGQEIEVLGQILGLFESVAAVDDVQVPAEVLALVEARKAAREAKDFAASDDLRDQIAALGYLLEDTAEGARITPK